MKISGWLIGLLTAVFLVSGFSVFFSSLNSEYGLEGFDESQYESLDKMSELQNNTRGLHDTVTNMSQDKSVLDIVGGFITSSYQSLKLVFSSVDTFNSMAETGAEGVTGLGEGVSLFKGFIIIVVALIVTLLILSAIMKWSL